MWRCLARVFLDQHKKQTVRSVCATLTLCLAYTSPAYFARSIAWTFINLLYFCISNQVFDPEEDKLNKPWRPIPSGRISVRSANILRFSLLPICLWTSWSLGVLPQTILFTLLGSAYNDLNIGKHWLPRQASVALMYGTLNSGAALAACDSKTPS